MLRDFLKYLDKYMFVDVIDMRLEDLESFTLLDQINSD